MRRSYDFRLGVGLRLSFFAGAYHRFFLRSLEPRWEKRQISFYGVGGGVLASRFRRENFLSRTPWGRGSE